MTVTPPPWTPEQQNLIAMILDAALTEIDRRTDWGQTADGRRRLPCPEQPLLLFGQPIGMYHCPGCDDMQIAGMPHLSPDPDYEQAMGQDWPPGYADAEAGNAVG